MRKHVGFFLFVSLIAFQSALGNTAEEYFPFLAQVSKESVNMRAGSNTNYEKIDKFSKGFELVVLGRSYDWYKVQLPLSAKVYIRSDYLKALQGVISEVTGHNVNVRVKADSNSTSLGQLKQGDLVRIIESKGGWSQIEPPAQAVGWVRQDFLIVKSSAVAPSLIRGPLKLQENALKEQVLITAKGRILPLTQVKEGMRYELVINGRVAYYIQNTSHMERFQGAMVVVKGVEIPKDKYQYLYPVLRVKSISLLL